MHLDFAMHLVIYIYILFEPKPINFILPLSHLYHLIISSNYRQLQNVSLA